MNKDPVTEAIIGAAIEMHRALGPGLLESAYEACLSHDLTSIGIPFRRPVLIPIRYKGIDIDCRYRIDMIIDEKVVVEIKTVERLTPLHEAQLLTYLKLTGVRTGLLINFNTAVF